MKTMETVEPGIFRRVDPRSGKVLPKLWIHYPGREGQTEREPTHTTSIVQARKLRAKRLEQHGRGEPGRSAEQVKVETLLDALAVDYEVNGRTSVPTLRGHVALLKEALGHLRVVDCTADRVQKLQGDWQGAGLSNASINRRCAALRRALVLGVRAGKVYVVPYIPRLKEHSPRGRYLPPADAAAIGAHLPEYVRPFYSFAYDNGTRKGQLARTLRRFVDRHRCVIVWPPDECKHEEQHVLPLEGEGLAIVERLMTNPPLWCPYLFHGPRCAPGQSPSKTYGASETSRRRGRLPAERPGSRSAAGPEVMSSITPGIRPRRTSGLAVWRSPTL